MDIGIYDEVMKFYSKKAKSSILGDSGFVEMVNVALGGIGVEPS